MKQSFQFKFLFLCFSLDSSRISQINTTQNSETSLSGFREKMSSGNHRRISPEEVQNVKNQIEQCLWNYMNKKQAMDILYQKQNIEPIFTKLVWERLEEENQEFFKTYYLKLALKNQITQFNDLLYQQAVADSNQANNPHGVACNGSHLHGSNFGFHQGVNHNNVAVKAENMQQYNFPAVVQGGFNGGGPFVQSVMQNGPVNMAVGTQNGNGVAVGGTEGYFGNSRFFYQATHVNGNGNVNLWMTLFREVTLLTLQEKTAELAIYQETSIFRILGEIRRTIRVNKLRWSIVNTKYKSL
ncbi:unnamed protein product [Lactuca saligna]|uniref:Angiotensin-converting enzyme 2 n=1 Tax=Lactuca saligna TaxID=75948 RepID=A0AA35Y8U7_LACSI|nr:unnamed protein product [Lactuca saligna]